MKVVVGPVGPQDVSGSFGCCRCGCGGSGRCGRGGGGYDDAVHNDVGLAKISTLVGQVRREKGRRNTLLIDAGGTIQGTQLSYSYAKVELREYLEYSARYYVQTSTSGPVDTAKLTHADGIPDYPYDAVSGVTYGIDIAKPVGSRIVGLPFEGKPVDSAARFVSAVNNYRASGGGNFPHVAGARQVWAGSDEIRNTIIAWVQEKGVVDPVGSASVGWRLTREGTPVFS